MQSLPFLPVWPQLSSHLRNLEEPEEVGDLDGGDAGGGAHHARDDLVADLGGGSVLALVLRVVVDVGYRACNAEGEGEGQIGGRKKEGRLGEGRETARLHIT